MGRPKLDINREIQCKECGETKPGSEFYLVKSNGYDIRLKTCIACERSKQLKKYHDKPRDDKYSASRKRTCRNHGITVEKFDQMVEDQDGLCPICRQRPDRFYIDHDHKHCAGAHGCAECVRGLLCGRCNSALGFLNDNHEMAYRATEYLKYR